MTARPILFSGPMIRALLEGRKTQTRRAMKPQPDLTPELNDHAEAEFYIGDECVHVKPCPYGQPGDLLWVRETFQPLFADGWDDGRNPDGSGDRANYRTGDGHAPHYVADCGPTEFVTPDGDLVTRCTPAIHMPRWASRLTLRITDVWVERLQDISEADALAEGVRSLRGTSSRESVCHDSSMELSGRDLFRALWVQINGPGSWDANPWVWALTFDVIKANVDQVHP